MPDAPAPSSSPVPHMPPDQFRRLGHELIDFIADYWQTLQSDRAPRVSSAAKPGDILAALPEYAPEQAEPWDRILTDLRSIIMPGLTHWQHPSFFAYFPCNGSGPGVLGELLSAGLGVNGMLWATSPAATELETRVLDWMADAIGLPDRFLSTAASPPGGGGVIQSTASESTLVALLAARQRHRDRHADDSREPVVYCSSQAHSSVIKAAMIAGIATGPADSTHARQIEVDENFAMKPKMLAREVKRDMSAGRRPIFVCATLGTTSSMAFDEARAIGDACRENGMWLHLDAAMAGCAFICPEYRRHLTGIDQADSICFNPHKWLLTTFDCDLFYTADRKSLLGALSILPEYLKTAAGQSGQSAAIDYRDWQIPLGRRFRALKLWFVIRHYGLEGLRAHIRESCRQAEVAERLLREDARLEIAAPRALTLVCFRARPLPNESPFETDARTRALHEAVNATGKTMLTHTTLPRQTGGTGMLVIRLSTGGTFTREQHVRDAVALIRETMDAITAPAR